MKTEVYTDYQQEVSAYVLNSELSEETYRAIVPLEKALESAFPGSIELYPQDRLHITLMDWLAPFTDYGPDRDQIFAGIKSEYVKAFQETLAGQGPIAVNFSEVGVSPNAIYAIGTDDGSYARLRDEFLTKVDLLPGTKQPPRIIHFTFGRFMREIDVDEVKNIVDENPVSVIENVKDFRLVHETVVPMLAYETIKRFVMKD